MESELKTGPAFVEQPCYDSVKKSKKIKHNKRIIEEIVDAKEVAKICENRVMHKADPTGSLCMDVKADIICDRHDRLPPVVGYFPSGYDLHKYFPTGEEYHQSDVVQSPTVRFYRNSQRVKMEKYAGETTDTSSGPERLEMIVGHPGSKVEFVGTSYDGEALMPRLCNYALGVLDKETQILKIMPIAGNKVFRLEPKIQRHGGAQRENLDIKNGELSGAKLREKVQELNSRYGSKIAVKQDKKNQALWCEDDPESLKCLGERMDIVMTKNSPAEPSDIHVNRNVPPHNASAATPCKAYPLDKIIHTWEWDLLRESFHDLIQEPESAIRDLPVFVANRMYHYKAIQDVDQKHRTACIFSYITHLLKFKDMHSLDGSYAARDHRIPDAIHRKFKGLFDPQPKRLLIQKLDLLVSYVLVLSLHADDFHSCPEDICKDLRMNIRALKSHFSNLGCKFIRERKVLYATLPVPIQFPQPRRVRRKW